jgi:hypothetical protein
MTQIESTESKEEVEQTTSVVRRSKRVRKLVKKYIPPNYVMHSC